MKSHRVQAELGDPRGHLVGRFMVGEIGGSREIRAEEPQAMIARVQVAVFDVYETGLPGGLIRRAADIRRPLWRRPKAVGAKSAAQPIEQVSRKADAVSSNLIGRSKEKPRSPPRLGTIVVQPSRLPKVL